MELYEGRPENTDERLPREVRTYDFLDRLGIEYKRTDHEPADNMEACNEIDAVLGVIICKNLFLCNRQKTNFYLLMMPGDKKFKTKELSSQINSARLSFADPEDMLKYLDIEPGAVSIMGLMNDKDHAVQLLIDEDVLKGEYLGCHPCVCTSSLKIKTIDVIEKYLPATGHEYMTVRLLGEGCNRKNSYRFYGWETADIKDEQGFTPRDYYDLLMNIWSEETCAPRLRGSWSPENRTLGQCSITAFLMQDIYGGKVYGIPRGDGNFHCFNDVDGCIFDLTSEQFGDEILDYSNCPEQFRKVHFQKEEKRLRYELLKTRLNEAF